MPGPEHFDRFAELYDRSRPPYPSGLWTRLSELGLLVDGARALDLGSGTGQAIGPLLRAGMTVTAVEPGPSLARLLHARFPNVAIVNARAEEAELPTATYALATAATSVHWFDLDVVIPKVHAALRRGGSFAVWRNAYGDPRSAVTPFRERVNEIVARRGDETPRRFDEFETEKLAASLSASGHFEVRHIEEFRWTWVLDPIQLRDLFTTFSNWTPHEAEEVRQAAEDVGGPVQEHYVTPLIVMNSIGS